MSKSVIITNDYQNGKVIQCIVSVYDMYMDAEREWKQLILRHPGRKFIIYMI